MGKVIRQSAVNALSNYLGIAIGALNLLVFFPRVFADEPAYFGLIQLIISYGLVISSFANLGIPRIILRYFPTIEKMEHGKLLTVLILYPLPLLTIASLVFFVFEDTLIPWLNNEPLFLQYWYYIIPFAIFSVYFELLVAVSGSFNKTQFPLFLKEVQRRLIMAALIGLYWLDLIDLQWFLLWYAFSLLLQVVVLVWFTLKHKFFSLKRFRNVGFQVKPMLYYGGFLFLVTGVNLLINKIDLLMIGKILDLEKVGYYSIAFFIGSILGVPGKSLLKTTQPLLAKAFAKKDIMEVERIYKATSSNLLIVAMLFFTLLVTNIHDLLFLLPEVYRGAEDVVLYIALGQLANASAGQNGEVISLSQYYRFNLWFLILLLTLTVVNNLIFIPRMGVEGAALATFISIALYNFIKTIFLKIKMNIWPLQVRSLLVLPLAVLCIVTGCFFQLDATPIIEIILRSLLITVIFIPIVYRLKLSAEINSVLTKAFRYVA